MKVSLHESGVCQYALLPEFYENTIAGLEGAPPDRTILRWHRLPTPKWRAIHSASIVFAAYDGVWLAHDQPRLKPYLLTPPQKGCGRHVDIFYSRTDPDRHLASIPSTFDLFECLKLKSGEYVSFLSSEKKLPEGFFDFRVLPKHGGISLGFDPVEEGDTSGAFSVHEIVQVREGSATLYSMHNMILRRVLKADAEPTYFKHWSGGDL